MKWILLIVGLLVAFALGGAAAGAAADHTFNKESSGGKYLENPDYEHMVSGALFQLSAEGNALMEQAFNTAMKQVLLMQFNCEDPAEPDWELRTGTDGSPEMYYQGKRVALISDVDDTLVDGAHYTCSIIGENGDWNNAAFARFLMSDGCTALPGAAEFINAAKDAGIEVFYVTNRYDQGYKIDQSDSQSSYRKTVGPDRHGHYIDKNGAEIGTSIYEVYGKSIYDISMESMLRLGFPADDHHLIVNDNVLNGPSKEPARQAIQNGASGYPTGAREGENADGFALTTDFTPHYVALYLGDQMTDFTDDFSTEGLDAAARAEKVKTRADQFGTRWIVLPNAVYGQAMDHAKKFGPKALFRRFSGWAKKVLRR